MPIQTENKIVIFDLDGTLINSAGGIAASVNRTRIALNLPPLDTEQITSFVGNGAKKLMERALQHDNITVSIDKAVGMMIAHYANNPLQDTFLYPEVKNTLEYLKNRNWILCVVSNKPQIISDKILNGLGIMPLLSYNIGGEAGFSLKPDPGALNFLLDKFNASPDSSWVIGDNYTDLAAAENAGMHSVFCRFGMGEKQNFTADQEIDNFEQLKDILT